MVSKEEDDNNKILEEELKLLNVTIINKEDITLGEEIGKGGFGKVYKSTYKGKDVAVKELMLSIGDSNALREISNEIAVITKAEQDRLPVFYGVLFGDQNLSLVFELIKGPTLKQKLGEMNDKEKLDSICQLLEILEHMHKKKLIHRDIKPANIMIEEGNKVRLIDFGVSKVASKTCTFTKSQMGTTSYMAPECFDVDIEEVTEKPIAISGQLDVWAVGTVASEIFSGGIIPWSQKCKNPLSIEIKLTNKKPFPIPEQVTNETAKKVIKACTVIDPNERGKAGDIVKMIREAENN